MKISSEKILAYDKACNLHLAMARRVTRHDGMALTVRVLTTLAMIEMVLVAAGSIILLNLSPEGQTLALAKTPWVKLVYFSPGSQLLFMIASWVMLTFFHLHAAYVGKVAMLFLSSGADIAEWAMAKMESNPDDTEHDYQWRLLGLIGPRLLRVQEDYQSHGNYSKAQLKELFPADSEDDREVVNALPDITSVGSMFHTGAVLAVCCLPAIALSGMLIGIVQAVYTVWVG